MLQTSLLLMKRLNKTEIPIFLSVFFVSKGIAVRRIDCAPKDIGSIEEP